MTRIVAVFLSVIVILIVAFGCSSGNSNPVTTQKDSTIDSPLILPETNENNSSRTPLGMWTLHFDTESLTASLEPNRELNRHYSVRSHIEPPVITVTYWDPVTETVHVNITIKNSSFLNVFDVRLIIFTDDVGHTLSNADGMTGLWDIPDGLPFNPFMAYAKTATRRNFQAQAEFTENLQIYCPDENFNIQFAIDACFPGNCEEPYAFENFTQDALYETPGSQATVTVDVLDWQDDVNEVYLHCPSITGPALLPFANAGGNTWELDFVNNIGVNHGEYKAWLLAKSANSGSLALYDETKITISIYILTGWAVHWGGDSMMSTSDSGRGVTSDRNGNAIVTGLFHSPCDFDPGPDEDIHLATGRSDIFLSKFNPDGAFLWARTWGGSASFEASERGEDVVTDNDGNIYVIGSYYGSADFDPGPDEDIHTSSGEKDIFLCKYDPDGNFIWAKTWGGVGRNDSGLDVTIDSEGYICVTGNFDETVDFDPGPGIEERTALSYQKNTYLSRFTPDGLFIWVRTWNAYGSSLSADNNGNIYIAGSFAGNVDFDPGADVDTRQSGSERDYCVSKFGINGDYKGVITGYSNVSVTSACVTTDADGDIYLIGNIYNQIDRYTWDSSLFVKKFNSSGTLLLNTYAHNANFNARCDGNSIIVDNSENIYITGYFLGAAYFHPGEWRTSKGEADIFIVKYNPQGNIIWINNYGDSNSQGYGSSITLDPNECIYATGSFYYSIDFDPGSGIDEHTSSGLKDVFLTKILPNGFWE
jgi:hypothetical protein